MSDKTLYRPEIDGLRAVAILPVLFFHAKLGFPGGYVGVDVFFVISGYLITALLLKDIDAGTFSLIAFWERRVRRLFPALLVVVAASVVAAWFMLLPDDFKEIGRSVRAQATMMQNVCFWRSSGYFAASSEVTPLLHTWSLGVEEQFYLILPLLLFALKRANRTGIVAALTLLCMASFVLSLYGMLHHPSATFYLLPMRAWELLVGSLLAARPRQAARPRWLDETLSWGGLLTILGAALGYDEQTRFPGAAALVPCLATAAIIWSNAPRCTSVGRLLTLRPMVGIGLISYSLYLCHWPLIVFAKYWAPAHLPLLARALLIVASFLLAILLWRYVETPCRKGWLLASRARVFVLAGLGLAVVFSAGRAINKSDGMRSRFAPAVLNYADGKADRGFLNEVTLAAAVHGDFARGGHGTQASVECLVWGDSHAMAIMPVLDALGRDRQWQCVAATHSSTPPLVDYACMNVHALREDSASFHQAVVRFVKTQRVRNVILAARWSGYDFRGNRRASGEHGPNQFREHLEKTVTVLRDAGAVVWILKEVPNHAEDIPKALARAAIFGADPERLGIPLAVHRERFEYENRIIDEMARPGVNALDPAPCLVDEAGQCRAERGGKALYCDSHHLTVYGSMQLRPLFEAILR